MKRKREESEIHPRDSKNAVEVKILESFDCSSFGRIIDLAATPTHIYVLDSPNQRVWKIDRTTKKMQGITVAGSTRTMCIQKNVLFLGSAGDVRVAVLSDLDQPHPFCFWGEERGWCFNSICGDNDKMFCAYANVISAHNMQGDVLSRAVVDTHDGHGMTVDENHLIAPCEYSKHIQFYNKESLKLERTVKLDHDPGYVASVGELLVITGATKNHLVIIRNYQHLACIDYLKDPVVFPWNANDGCVCALGSGEILVSANRPKRVLHRLKIRQPLARALLSGLHGRCGRTSLFSRPSSSLFDVQVLRIPLRLAGVLFRLGAGAPKPPSGEED